MKLKFMALLLLAGAPLLAGHWFVGVGIGAPYPIYTAPPPPPVYYAPPAPGPGYSWISGYYYPVGPRWVWRGGYWARPPYARAYWVGPRYYRNRWYRGYWRR